MASEKEKARIRPDAIISQVDSFSYELENPETGAILKLDDTGYLVAEQFESGEFTIDEVVRRLRDDNGVKISRQDVLGFLKRADALNLLEQSLQDLGIDMEGIPASEDEFSPSARISEATEFEKLYRSSWVQVLNVFDRKTWISILICLCVFVFPWPNVVVGNLVIKAKNEVTLRASVPGTIKEVLVSEGDAVRAGQVLVRMEGYENDILRKRSEIPKLEAELEQLRSGATPAEINEAKKELELAQQITAQARDNASRLKELFRQNLISEQALQTSESDYDVKRKELERVQAKLELIQSGPRPELIQAKKAELEALLVDLRLLESFQRMQVLRSPLDGLVVTKDVRNLIERHLEPGEPILSIASNTSLTTETLIPERDISSLSRGQKMKFKVHALPNQSFETTIARISPIGEFPSNPESIDTQSTFRIYSNLEKSDVHLRPGMTGVGKIHVGTSMFGVLFLSRFIRFIRVNYVI